MAQQKKRKGYHLAFVIWFNMEKIKILNTYINNISLHETLSKIEQFIHNQKKAYIVAVNVDVIMKIEGDNYLKEIVNKADIVLADGKPLVWISKIYKRPIKAKISGSDLVPLICQMAERRGYSIFILGGKEGVALKASERLVEHFPKINIVGTYAPPIGFEHDIVELEKANKAISEANPDILITCLGCPKQEKFIYENINIYNAIVSICAGATVDFLAGDIKRAPKWLSNVGLEWFYRFIQEPKRLFKRYFIDDMKILRLIWKYR